MLELVGYPVPAPRITGGFRAIYHGARGPFEHGGIDFGCPVGTPIYAPADGIAQVHADSGGVWDFGNWISLRHVGTGLYSAYAHLAAFRVADGEAVRAGQVLGLSGNTGKSTGPHLHWAVSTNQWFALNFRELRDPAAYLATTLPGDQIVKLLDRLARLENLVAGYGLDAVPYADVLDLFPAGTPVALDAASGPTVRLRGEAALEYARRRGFSFALGVQNLNASLGELIRTAGNVDAATAETIREFLADAMRAGANAVDPTPEE